MDPLQHPGNVSEVERMGILRRLRNWWCQPLDADNAYFAGAADLAYLERRRRIVERGGRVTFFVTFNH
jgi:hypothetical protein